MTWPGSTLSPGEVAKRLRWQYQTSVPSCSVTMMRLP